MSYLRAEGTIEEFGKKDELLLEPDDVHVGSAVLR
jgi:hypothetical protein